MCSVILPDTFSAWFYILLLLLYVIIVFRICHFRMRCLFLVFVKYIYFPLKNATFILVRFMI